MPLTGKAQIQAGNGQFVGWSGVSSHGVVAQMTSVFHLKDFMFLKLVMVPVLRGGMEEEMRYQDNINLTLIFFLISQSLLSSLQDITKLLYNLVLLYLKPTQRGTEDSHMMCL